jgi:hypothetical protein
VSAVYLLLLLLSVSTAAVMGVVALVAVRALRREVAGVRAQLSQPRAPIPAAREATETTEAGAESVESVLRRRAEIREAVAEALADERERELAEARAFWAAQESRETPDAPFFDGRADEGGDPSCPPRQIDLIGFAAFHGTPPNTNIHGPFDQQFTDALREAIEELADEEGGDESVLGDDALADTPPAAPDMRRHPSHPDFKPAPVVADQQRTIDRLGELAKAGTPLADVRPGPLGTLDIYVFGDGTTLCMTPSDRAATDQLLEALRSGTSPLLLGGSGIGGAYALTFGVGEESVYVLADRVVASF